MPRTQNLEAACIKYLNVSTLEVTNLKVLGESNVKGDIHPKDVDNSNIQRLEHEIEKLKKEIGDMKLIIKNLKMEDLTDINLDGKEDGAFLGWNEEAGLWVPYPEIGT